MPDTPAPLPDDIDALKALLVRRDDELQQLRDTVSTLELALSVRTLEIEQLKLQIAKFKRMQFGRKSEKIDRKIEQLETRLEDLLAEEGAAEQKHPAPPPMKLLHGKVSNDGQHFELGGNSAVLLPNGCSAPAAGDCILGLRPEHLTIGRPGISMVVEMVEALGADLLVHAQAGDQAAVVRAPVGTKVEVGQHVTAGFDPSSVHWFDIKTTHRIN